MTEATEMTGAKAVVKTLETEGVKLVIGYMGHTSHELADAILDAPGIRTFHPKTELTGSFMVDGYNRIAGKSECVGVWHGPATPQLVGGLGG
ncbi:MAG: thiamine pyrophosphate-binding protein [Chloroflexi bacterium]|nr:thiamine pyrophosphate-binding protein [Chloroflexota bacterium]